MRICLHRYAAHSGFKCGPITQFFLNILGCLVNQGSPIWWASQHRCHYKYCNAPHDPHIPIQDGVKDSFAFFRSRRRRRRGLVDVVLVVVRGAASDRLGLNPLLREIAAPPRPLAASDPSFLSIPPRFRRRSAVAPPIRRPELSAPPTAARRWTPRESEGGVPPPPS